ncbi:MAG TPA: lysylphosphatidylglycerol synthase transmembrane domain-containing protein [Methylomirabilota bacterium]
MPSAGRLIKILLGIAISVALLVWLFWKVDVRAVFARLADTHWGWLAVSIVVALSSLWARAVRWRLLFPRHAHPTHLFNAVMIGYMGNNVLPLRAGEVLRVYVVTRRGQPFWTTVTTLVVERALDGVAIGAVLAFVFFLIPTPREIAWAAETFVGVVLLMVIVLVGIAAAPMPCRILIHSLCYRWPAIDRRLLAIFDSMSDGLQGMRRPAQLVPTAVWSVVIWMAIVFSVWACFRAARLDLPVSAALCVIAFIGLGVSLPSSPGFIGVFQAATVLALSIFGVDKVDALGFSLLLHASQFIPVTLWGLLLLVVEHVSLTDAARARETPGMTPPGDPD